jgi:general L-amino acid transport system permease protein
VIFPQALRVIIPPLTSQYLNLTKNSSLAIAIGYPDVYFVAYTSLNQTGKAVEIMLLIMLTYLTLSLTISLIMNLFNRTVQIQER